MNFELRNEITEKEKKWQEIERDVDTKKDKLGKKIDAKIKFAVIALIANGFETLMSCEGHENWGLPYPWVRIESPASKKLLRSPKYIELHTKARAARQKEGEELTEIEVAEYKKLRQALQDETEKTHQRLTNLLNEFYEKDQADIKKSISKHIRLTWHQSRLQPEGMPEKMKPAEIQEIWSQEEKTKNLESYRQEMDRFAEFLKKKFFESKT